VGDSIRWLHWSPDGSELGYLTIVHTDLVIISLRRDIRDESDRTRRTVRTLGGGGTFTWGW
jgi:hypothetical protein